MFTLKDISDIFCCSKSSIEKKVKKITPIFKNFDNKKRKHFYNQTEASFLIKSIGIPPDNEFNRKLGSIYPLLFK